MAEPSGFRELLVDILRTSVRRGNMNANAKPTAQSLVYRKRASDLGRLAATKVDELKMLPLVHQALAWIQLAENEEMLAEANRVDRS